VQPSDIKRTLRRPDFRHKKNLSSKSEAPCNNSSRASFFFPLRLLELSAHSHPKVGELPLVGCRRLLIQNYVGRRKLKYDVHKLSSFLNIKCDKIMNGRGIQHIRSAQTTCNRPRCVPSFQFNRNNYVFATLNV
jgi:hypothetical protein